MAEQPIEIQVEFDGAEQAVRQLGQVSGGVEQLGTKSADASRSFSQLAQGGQQLVQRVQGVAGAVQSLVSALGGTDRTAGLVASVAGATAQFAAMGSLLGPAGTVVGGLVGLTTSLVSAARASDDAGDGISAMGLRAATAEERVRALTDALADMARNSRIDMGVASMAEYDREIATVEARLDNLRVAFENMDTSLAGSTSERALTAEIRAETARLEELRRTRGEAAAEEAAILEEDLYSAANPEPTRRSSGRRPQQGEDAGLVDVLSNDLGGVNQQADMAAERVRVIEEAIAEVDALRDEELDRELERWDREAEKAREASQLEIDIAKAQFEEMERLAQEEEDRRAEADARALESREQASGELTGMLGDTVMMFGKAVGAVAAGEKTAEEAFTGMAKAFLEMISQYATLKAATEFADAAGSFARYDYGGGAAHIAAGVAFTAVAVATGVGAAAINTAPAAPARPEANGGTAEGAGGDIIINWNSPVVTAGTYADLGRELQAATDAARSI